VAQLRRPQSLDQPEPAANLRAECGMKIVFMCVMSLELTLQDGSNGERHQRTTPILQRRSSRASGQTWLVFLHNHVSGSKGKAPHFGCLANGLYIGSVRQPSMRSMILNAHRKSHGSGQMKRFLHQTGISFTSLRIQSRTI
jgi:hypothetical protein